MARKKPPTKAEREHMSRVASLGCWVCGQPAQVHHIRNKGKGFGNVGIGNRSSHYDTIPLCMSHHTGNFSIHNRKKEFEAKYGTEHEILQKVKERIQCQEDQDIF